MKLVPALLVLVCTSATCAAEADPGSPPPVRPMAAPTTPPTSGGDWCDALVCSKTDGGGKYIGLSRAATSALPPKGRAKFVEAGKKVTKEVPYQYVTLLACGNNSPVGQTEIGCTAAYETCQGANVEGPYTRIYRKLLTPDAARSNVWENVGTTCFPTAVPNAVQRPRLTLAMIRSQWERTQFAKPTVSMQPIGGKTLVTLPTFFQLAYPATGFQPNEINTVNLLGHQVRIKPTFKHNVFSYGDGGSSGPTQSGGGVYPDGDIKHAYDKSGTYVTSVSTTYGGQYSVDGGDWADIPGSVTVAGPSSQIQVVTTKNQLVNN